MKNVNFIDGIVIEKRDFSYDSRKKTILLLISAVILLIMLYVPYIEYKNLQNKKEEIEKTYKTSLNDYNENMFNFYNDILNNLKNKKIYSYNFVYGIYKCTPKDLNINSVEYNKKSVLIEGETKDYSLIEYFINELENNFKNQSVRPLRIDWESIENTYKFYININLKR
ncbi:hypothetical protein SAMN05443428_104127 [Caloramator quimbayensis]|uniref:Uncharacterized protein n=1 Tax=Caloramator quimbayensis TaxID=1147123 RepID=A0A1T4WXB3_9CLOT|nr:hypothetical protein [Caloramator quimbayensis]SKA81859.1 hypothetical protein SAMN05443428_104127 [Caloramator quimbayensis]